MSAFFGGTGHNGEGTQRGGIGSGRLLWFILALIATLLQGCGGGGSDSKDDNNGGGSTKAKWTYLVYVAADNTLSDMADFNLNQMKAANHSADVNVVVQLERSTQYSTGADTNTYRGKVTKGAANLVSVGGNLAMANRQTLSDFIKWGKQTYPADRYAVVLWSHGGGWKANKAARGALQDLTSNGEGMMTIRDIAWALRDAGGVDLLNFDACLMAMYEVAYELRDTAKVMVASEEVIPGEGNPYDKVLNRLVANPAQDAAALGAGIVSDYDEFYRTKNREATTLSAIDLTKMAALDGKIRETAALLISSLASDRLSITAARDAAPSYKYVNNRDLITFADELATRATSSALRSKAAELAATARSAMLASRVFSTPAPALASSSGLAIYLPTPANTTTDELSQYQSSLSSNVALAAGGSAWSQFVVPLVTGGSGPGQTTGSGAFAYAVTWDNPDVDLDLLVNEPEGNWAGPAHGPTSVNSFSSADSYDSGEAFETYVANDALERGAYDVFVYYAGCRSGVWSCGSTIVSVYRYDPSAGDADAVLVSRRYMDATPSLDIPFDPFSSFIAAVSTDEYGDWLYVQQTTRTAAAATVKRLPGSPKVIPKALKSGVHK